MCLQLAALQADGVEAGTRSSGVVDLLGELAIFYHMAMTLWIHVVPLLLDLVGYLVHLCPLLDDPVFCIFTWAVLWCVQFPVWLWIFTSYVPFVVFVVFRLLSHFHLLALRLCFGTALAQSLPSGRLRELYRKLSSPMARLGNETLSGSISLCCLECGGHRYRRPTS